MATVWGAVLVLLSLGSLVVRDLIALHRQRSRYAAIERLAATAAPGARIVDRSIEGVVTEIVVGPDRDRLGA